MKPQAITFSGIVTDGRLPRPTVEAMRRLLDGLSGKAVNITIGERTRKRSNAQNAYYYGVVIPLVRGLFSGGGELASPDYVHRYLKGEIGGMKRLVIRPDGIEDWEVDTSTKLSTTEWENWMDAIRAWAAGFDLQIPLPGETV